jgi:hypothetical protein
MSGECVRPLAKDGWDRRPSPLNPDGSFVIEGLRAGSGTFVLGPKSRTQADRTALVTIPAVQVAGVTRDPRLQGIDLRDVVRARVLIVVDPDGAPVAGADVKYRPKGVPLDSGATVCETGVDGRATLVTGVEPVSATLSKEGHLSRSLDLADAEARVVLERAVVLEIAVSSDAALPIAPENLLIFLRPEGAGTEPYRPGEDPYAIADSAGVAVITAPFTGAVRLMLQVNREGASHDGGTLAIEIMSSPARQRVEWRVPAEAIRKR